MVREQCHQEDPFPGLAVFLGVEQGPQVQSLCPASPQWEQACSVHASQAVLPPIPASDHSKMHATPLQWGVELPPKSLPQDFIHHQPDIRKGEWSAEVPWDMKPAGRGWSGRPHGPCSRPGLGLFRAFPVECLSDAEGLPQGHRCGRGQGGSPGRDMLLLSWLGWGSHSHAHLCDFVPGHHGQNVPQSCGVLWAGM